MMRKSIGLIVLLALLLAVPAAAQGTVVDIAVGNPNFSTLVSAVQAAGLAETLAGNGPFTVFAPTNDAFAKIPAPVLQALIADKEALTEVLTYHVLPGRLLASGVAAINSFTPLQGGRVSVTVSDQGVFLNDTVQVIATDITASNGVIHVIDSVLVPAGGKAAALIADMSKVRVRVAHFSPDTPAVDVYVNGALSPVTGLAFPNVTPWIELEPGTYNIAVAPAGTSIDQAAIGPADFDLPLGAYLTVAAVGSLANGTLKPQVIVENYSSAIPANNARVGVFHAIEDAPPVDVLANGSAIIRMLAFPGSRGDNDGFFDLNVPSGVYNLQVVPFGRSAPVVLAAPNTFLAAGVNYFIAAVGTLDSPQVVVVATDPATKQAPTARGLAAILTSVPDLSNLAGFARQIGFAATLQRGGPFTVFAPRNAAFDALRAAVGLATYNQLVTDANAGSAASQDILLYHIVPGKLLAADVAAATSLRAANNQEITVEVRDGQVFLNGSVRVVATDIVGTNGVIHIIDGVLVPPAE